MSQPPDWAAMFDSLSAAYDQSGVPFFGPIARELAERAAPAPGARVAELGCGRGALTLLLAEAVGPSGRVDAIDISPEMVRLTTEVTEALPQVSVALGDAAAPELPRAGYDVAAASLVLFFLPDPVAALRGWRALLVERGRLAVSTFGTPPPSWAAMEQIFEDAVVDETDAADLRGGASGPFGSDAGVEGLFTAAGLREVSTETVVLDVPFRDLAQWEAWLHGTALLSMWRRLSPEGRDRVRARTGALLDAEGGRLEVAIRLTLGRRLDLADG